MSVKLMFSLFSSYLITGTLTSHINQNIIINNVLTNVDLSTQLVKIDHLITFTSLVNDLKTFIFMVDPVLFKNVANITVITKERAIMQPGLPVEYNEEGRFWLFYLDKPLLLNESSELQASIICSNVLKSHPARFTQHAKHLVLYDGPISLYSPFIILKHRSLINIGKGDLVFYTTPRNFLLYKKPLKFMKDNSNNLPEQLFINSIAKIHFEHKKKFLSVKILNRTIEVSHWCNISVTEIVDLEYSGVRLYNSLQSDGLGNNDVTTVTTLTTFLPGSASDISICDDVGIISTVQLKKYHGFIAMKFSPRILFNDGWKGRYTLKYLIPSSEYLFNKGKTFALKIKFIDHIFEDMVIDSAVVKIILPEGSEKAKIVTPYEVQYLNDSYHKSYMDVHGKPVITMMKINLVEQHTQEFILSYTFSKYRMLFVPLYITVFLELIFLIIILFKRFNFFVTDEGTDVENSEVEVISNVFLTKLYEPNSSPSVKLGKKL